jgi:hypothetical protein
MMHVLYCYGLTVRVITASGTVVLALFVVLLFRRATACVLSPPAKRTVRLRFLVPFALSPFFQAAVT